MFVKAPLLNKPYDKLCYCTLVQTKKQLVKVFKPFKKVYQNAYALSFQQDCGTPQIFKRNIINVIKDGNILQAQRSLWEVSRSNIL